MNGQINEYLSSSDEDLLAIGASLLDAEGITDEEKQFWIDTYIDRFMDKNFKTEEHKDSLHLMHELSKRMRQNGT